MNDQFFAKRDTEYKWAGTCRLAKWMKSALCPAFGYDQKRTSDRLEDTIMQFGLYMDLGQGLLNAGARGIKEELHYIYDHYGQTTILFSNRLKYLPVLPPMEEVWTAYCYRRYELGNHCSGSAMMGSWQVMAGNMRLDEIWSGNTLRKGVTENYLISSLLQFEFEDRKYKRDLLSVNPMMYFISLALIFTEYQEQRESVTMFRDFEQNNVLFIRDRDRSSAHRLEEELVQRYKGMQLQFRTQRNGVVRMWLPGRFWKENP